MNPLLEDDPRVLIFVEFKDWIDQASQALEGDRAQFTQQLAHLQQAFDGQVQLLDWEGWPSQQRSLLQSLRVEMHKQLRLLTTDLMFLKAAKRAETLEQRQKDMGDRLTNLKGYCDAILKLAQGKTAEGAPEE